MSRVTRSASDGRVQLSPHFYLDQFLPADANPPAPTVIQNLFKLAARLEHEVAKNGPARVKTGYIDPLTADASDSPHYRGNACVYRHEGETTDHYLTLEN